MRACISTTQARGIVFWVAQCRIENAEHPAASDSQWHSWCFFFLLEFTSPPACVMSLPGLPLPRPATALSHCVYW